MHKMQEYMRGKTMNVHQMNHLQTVSHKPFIVAPKNIGEAIEYSKMIAASCFCPTNMRNKPGDVLVAIQLGAEVGLSPIQALQNIAVINNRPCLWGDATVAVVQGHSHYVSHEEWTDGTIEAGDMTAFCKVMRKGSEPHVRSFSIEDAKRAGLWKKAGPWTQYPARMLQMRARAFAFRDKFSDALKGLNQREEVQDYDVVDLDPVRATVVEKAQPSQPSSHDALEHVFEGFMDEILEAKNMLVLKDIWDRIGKVNWTGTEYRKRLADAKDFQKEEIMGEKHEGEKQENGQEVNLEQDAFLEVETANENV